MAYRSELFIIPDEYLDEFRELPEEELADRMKNFLGDPENVAQLASLYGRFVKEDSRYTLDEDSGYIELVELESASKGKIYGGFTQSVYWGCKDMDDVGDEQDFELALTIDLEAGTVEVGADFLERDMTEEF
jgi:hypothetical protein